MNGIIRQLNLSIKNSITRQISVKASEYNEDYSTKKDEQSKIVHSGGFKRDHDDKETKKSFYNCENEKWFPEQLNSGENYKDKIVDDRGNGRILFPYKYGNSFWDPHNYN